MPSVVADRTPPDAAETDTVLTPGLIPSEVCAALGLPWMESRCLAGLAPARPHLPLLAVLQRVEGAPAARALRPVLSGPRRDSARHAARRRPPLDDHKGGPLDRREHAPGASAQVQNDQRSPAQINRARPKSSIAVMIQTTSV